MPSTYTTNGGIELPANGEQASTWGTTVNDNMQIIDRLTNGVGTITLSGTTHTLTTSDGALSDGQYSVLVLSGSPSGTNTITVEPNDAQHVYIVKNASGQTATFTQGSGANVSVLDGTTKIIYCDGGGTGAAVVDLTGSIDLGALIVAGVTVTATGAELNILDGVTATTAELNILDGVTATTAELNILDGVTADATEINILDGVTATTAELNILDGVTATTAELNILDGVTADATELNILDGVTATTAEINLLDGVTATTAEINYVDGVTSAIQTQLDAKAADTTQAAATWEAGTGTTESIVSPAKVKAAIESLLVTDYTMNQNGYLELFMGFKLVWGTFTSTGDDEIDVTFHEAFDNACWGVTLGGFTNYTSAGGANGSTYDMTLTGFKTNRPDSTDGTNLTMRYIAWGN